MSDLVRYNSFDELKDSSERLDTDVGTVMERYELFAEAMHLLRNEYLQSKAPAEDTTSINVPMVHGLR